MKKEKGNMLLEKYVDLIEEAAQQPRRSLSLPMTERYWKNNDIKTFLGYDQLVLWQVVVEIMWLHFLKQIKFADVHIKDKDLKRLFSITTTMQDEVEKKGVGPKKLGKGHDILALLQLIKMPLAHMGLTSYDTICTAHALMYAASFQKEIVPAMLNLDRLWREKIAENARVLQMGRTHFQNAIPIMVGFWLSMSHNRFQRNAKKADAACGELTGTITGAVGTSAALKALGIIDCYERSSFSNKASSYEEYFLCNMLGLGEPCISSQIVQPELLTRFFFELVMVSGSLANLGEDARILQGSAIKELQTESSSSSTMAHKDANPVVAENIAGTYTTILSDFMKPLQNQVSLLQRDLKGSGPMRDYTAIPAYVYLQILNETKLLKSMIINREQCRSNFEKDKYYVMGELLHLALNLAGMSDSHEFVNKEVVPYAKKAEVTLVDVVDYLVGKGGDSRVRKYWSIVPDETKELLVHPERYTGLASEISYQQSRKKLKF